MNQGFIIVLQKEMEAVNERERRISEEEETIKRETAERLRALTEKRAEMEARRRHLQALLALEGVEIDKPELGEGIGAGAAAGSKGEAVTLADQVYYYLLETGQEQHYREITKALQAKGVRITGKDPALNLVANIHADERFKRPRRGVYGLIEWYPKKMPSAGTRKKQVRKRRRTAERK